MKHMSFIKNEKGVIGLYLAIVVMVFAMGMIASVSFGIFTQQQIIRNIVQSSQAHYAAESGVEDALLRLRNGMNWLSPYSISFWTGSSSTVNIVEDPLTGVRTITVEGDSTNRIRNTEVVFEQTSTGVGFFYGAQVGEGGIELQNSSKIIGNVFSNGDILHQNTAQIAGTAQIAEAGNEITGDGDGGVEVTGDLYADHCEDSTVGGIFYGMTHSGCTFSSFVLQTPPASVPFPITQSQIDTWKTEAEVGGTIGSYARSSGTSSLGPVKIDGNLTIQNTAQLVVTGTLWVTGNITIQNSAQVRLDPGYGTTSGMIIADGVITLENDSISSGSGQSGSYLMYLSTYPGIPSTSAALIFKNSARTDIVYTTNGFVEFENNSALREVTAYGLRLKNSAELAYELGLQSTAFTSGPGGGWTVTSWKEIE